MGKIATSPVDVLLGEAAAGDFHDMLNIASVMANRANALNTTLEDVVANRREFNAYQKSLPAGVDQYRDLAKAALDYVAKAGPVNNATFYATPDTAGNLPKGLEKITNTAGHEFYSDPYGRSIATASGYKTPDLERIDAPAQTTTRFAEAPVPQARPGTAEIPTYDSLMQTAGPVVQAPMNFDPPASAIRNQPVQAELTDKIATSVSRMGPEYGWTTVSGGQPSVGMMGVSRTGSTRHNDGFAIDGALTVNGQRLDPVRNYQEYMDLMTNLAEDGIGGLGHYGWGIHADLKTPNAWGPTTHTASLDPGFEEAINQGRALSSLNGNYPTPQPRPDVQVDPLVASVPDETMDLAKAPSVPELAYTPAETAKSPFSEVMATPEAPDLPTTAAAYTDSAVSTPNYGKAPQPEAPEITTAPVDVVTHAIAEPVEAPAPMSLEDQYAAYGEGRALKDAAVSLAMDVQDATGKMPRFDAAIPSMSPTAPAMPKAPSIEDVAPEAPTAPGKSSTTSRSSVSQPSVNAQADAVNRSNAMKDTKTLAGLQQQDNIMGGIISALGGVVGGALLGPIGGILGTKFAPSLFPGLTQSALNFYPTAPINPNASGGGSGYDSLSDAGRDVYNSSGNFRDAVDAVDEGRSGGGLW